jgi:hypothetical protein
MNEASVDHSVREGRPIAETIKIIERSTLHIGARRSERRGGSIRTSQPEHLMTCANEFWNDGGANEARSPSDKDTHCFSPSDAPRLTGLRKLAKTELVSV